MLSGALPLLAGLALIASIWAGEAVNLAIALLLILSKSLLVFVLLGVFSAYTPKVPGLWFSGFLVSILGVQFDLADFFTPLGPTILLGGLIMMAIAVPGQPSNLRAGFWMWILANTVALGSVFLGLSTLLSAAVCVAGMARLIIGRELMRAESQKAMPETG